MPRALIIGGSLADCWRLHLLRDRRVDIVVFERNART